MKSVSAIIAIILILMIVVALASLFYVFSSAMFSSITQAGTTSMTSITETLSSCMKIDNIYQNKLYLRNCGQGVISNNSLSIYIDDVSFSFNMTPSSINQGELATLKLPIWGISIGLHTLKIANPKTQLIKTVEASLPDSAVLALDFDEGSGNIVYDKSRYNSQGTLKNSTGSCSGTACPSWVNGKFGKALEFDGIGDYVNITDSSGLNIADKITIEAWVKLKTLNTAPNPSPRILARIIDFNNRYDFYFYDNNDRMYGGFKKAGSFYLVSTIKNDWILEEWYHIAWNYDKDVGTNNIKIYVNGQFNESATHSMGTIPTGTACVYVGAYENGDIFNGIIDSIRIYNKALTPDETVFLKLK